MPFIEKKYPSDPAAYRQFVDAIAAELKEKSVMGPGPRIIEEQQRRGGFIHVTVIWDEWKNVPVEDRGRIIMDAYERERNDVILKITVALGLTSDEAHRLGIDT
ncbi:MAG: hypothetical protein WCI95_05965 [bacterium]